MCEVFKDIESWEYEYKTDVFIKCMQEALKVVKESDSPELTINFHNYGKFNFILSILKKLRVREIK